MIRTPLDIAYSFLGVAEIPGPQHNPLIVGMAHWLTGWVSDDETAWCGALVGFCVKLYGGLPLPANPLGARQWLTVGRPTTLAEAHPGFTLAIFRRGLTPQPGPDVIDAPGHVGFFYGIFGSDRILVLGGNQSNQVNIRSFSEMDLLGLRDLG